MYCNVTESSGGVGYEAIYMYITCTARMHMYLYDIYVHRAQYSLIGQMTNQNEVCTTVVVICSASAKSCCLCIVPAISVGLASHDSL